AGATLALQQPNPFASQATPLWQAIVAQLLLESALRPLCGRYRSAGDHGSAPPMGLVRGHAATRACADLRTRCAADVHTASVQHWAIALRARGARGALHHLSHVCAASAALLPPPPLPCCHCAMASG